MAFVAHQPQVFRLWVCLFAHEVYYCIVCNLLSIFIFVLVSSFMLVGSQIGGYVMKKKMSNYVIYYRGCFMSMRYMYSLAFEICSQNF